MNPDLTTWTAFVTRLGIETILITAAAGLADRLMRRASARVWIWQSALAAIALLWCAELLDLRPFRSSPLEPTPATSAAPAARHLVAQAREEQRPEVAADPSPSVSANLPATVAGPNTPPASPVRWPGLLWLAGTVFLLSRLLARRLWLIRWVGAAQDQQHPDAETTAAFRRLTSRLGLSTVRLIVSPTLRGPVAFGLWSPTVAIPHDFSSRFAPAQREAMLIHELAHLAGRDPGWNLFAEWVGALAWWHPAVAWARVRLRAATESAADEAASLVPGGRVALAEALVVLARDLVSSPPLRGLGIVGDGVRSPLARRVTALLRSGATGLPAEPRSPAMRWPIRGLALGAVGVALAAPWPGPVTLGLREALQFSDRPAASTTLVSAAPVSGYSPATVSSLLQDPQYRQVAAALAQANSGTAAPTPPSTAPASASAVPSGSPATPPTITLEVKFAEIEERSSDDLGLDWLFGQSPTNNPAPRSGGATDLPPQEEPLQGRGLRVDLLRTEGQATTMGAAQFAALLQRLEGRGGLELLAAPRLTMLSGREARIQVSEARTIVTGVETEAGETNRVNYLTEKLQVGQSVEVVPVLEDDTVRLKITASMTEFLGYDDPRSAGTASASSARGTPVQYQEPLPRVRVRQTVADRTTGARAGETVLLRGPLVTETRRTVDKVVGLGDLPLLGRLFRNESSSTVRKRLYVFVTPGVKH